MLKAAIVGFGGIAKAHRHGYEVLQQEGLVRLVAACDIDEGAFTRNIGINLSVEEGNAGNTLHFYTDLVEMLEKEKPDFVDICTPTYCHPELAVAVLGMGYPVLCEKPMALTAADTENMLRAERESGKPLMIAQCVRFMGEYAYLHDCVTDGRYGCLRAAYFSRISAPPIWGSNNWFMDFEKSGGVLTDMHIHDIDVARHIFGQPQAVSCREGNVISRCDVAHTTLHYGSAPVTVIGDWSLTGVPFSETFRVNLEGATLVLEGGVLTVYPRDGQPFTPTMPAHDGYTAEIAYFCRIVKGELENTVNPAADSAKTIQLIEAMRKSAAKDGAVVQLS